MMRSARAEARACASVLATRKSTPDNPEAIMLFTALQPPPPTPQTMMRGFNSLSSGAFRLMVIIRAFRCTRCATASIYSRQGPSFAM